MELEKRWVTHERGGESLSGYLVKASGVKQALPAVLVIQEIWGPDEHIQDVADRLAMAGYVALAPDLYSRGGRPDELAASRIEEVKSFMNTVPPGAWADQALMQESLRKQPADQASRIQGTMARLFGPKDTEGMLSDLKAWVDYLQASPQAHGQKVGSTGYCMGGALSFLLAASDARLQVALVYYGSAPDADRMSQVHCPVYGFYGEQDARITDAVPKVSSTMKELGKTYEATVYRGAPHAFFNDSRASYTVDAARDAWAKSLSWFNHYLG